MLKSNKKQISIAKARTVEERGRYANGSGQASFVISAQNNEQNAQLGYAQVATNYQKAVLDFKATIDQLVRWIKTLLGTRLPLKIYTHIFFKSS